MPDNLPSTGPSQGTDCDVINWIEQAVLKNIGLAIGKMETDYFCFFRWNALVIIDFLNTSCEQSLIIQYNGERLQQFNDVICQHHCIKLLKLLMGGLPM